MKKYILIIIAVISFTAVQGQENKKSKKVEETSFKVDGVCGDCKARIESAAMRTKGVKTASWDKETKILKVAYNSSKVDLSAIKLAVANRGHDAGDQQADSTAYSNLPGCCKYKDGAKCGH